MFCSSSDLDIDMSERAREIVLPVEKGAQKVEEDGNGVREDVSEGETAL